MKPDMIILAAGMGSRYGGIKQIDPMTPHNEGIINFLAYDAARSGFGRIIFLIRKEIEEDFRMCIGERVARGIEVQYAFQSQDAFLPQGFDLPSERRKPWGTAHATLCAAVTTDRHYAVLNADDFYGCDAIGKIGKFLSGRTTTGEYSMAGYRLKNTLSEYGSVSRGICETDDGRFLREICEHTEIEIQREGIISKLPEQNRLLTGEEYASMNLFGFTTDFTKHLEKLFHDFIGNMKNPLTDEFYLPLALDVLLKEGKVAMEILPTEFRWFGVTYPEDKPRVKERINELVVGGAYPSPLSEEGQGC